MLINICDQVSFRCNEFDSAIFEFIEQEYAAWFQKDIGQPVDYEIEILNDRVPSNAYIVRPPVSYDQKGVYVFDADKRVVRIEYDKIGVKRCSVTCDQFFNPNFFAIILEALIAFVFLGKGSYFCHASAFKMHDKVILCPAWRNTGKTNVLLSFLMSGADYIGDDWTLVNKKGGLFSLPKRLNILHYNIKYYPEILSLIDSDLQPLVEFINHVSEGKFNLDSNTIQDLKDKTRLRLSPSDISVETCSRTKRIDYIFFLAKDLKGRDFVTIERLGKTVLKNKMVEIIKFEQNHLLAGYALYKARSGNKNEYLEKCLLSMSELVEESLSNVDNIYQVFVPGQNCSKEVKDKILSIVKEVEVET